MIDGFVTVLMSACLVLLAAALVSSAVHRALGVVHLAVAAAIEIAVVVQVVIALARLIGGAEIDGVVLFLAYAAFCVVVLPIGALFAIEEKTRWSGVILAVSSLALIITLWRLNGVWTGTDV